MSAKKKTEKPEQTEEERAAEEAARIERERNAAMRRVEIEVERLTNAVTNKEEEAKVAKAALAAYTEGLAVEEMRRVELTEWTSPETGARLVCGPQVHVGIKVENRGAAYAWLIANGYGAVVQTELSVTFPKGDHERAHAFRKMVATLLPHADVELYQNMDDDTLRDAIAKIVAESFPEHKLVETATVHAGQLKALVKKILSAGGSLPEVFGIHAPTAVTYSSKVRGAKDGRGESPDF
jgi:hypothetical protein